MPVFYLFFYCLFAWKALLFCPCFHSHTRVLSAVLKLWLGVCLHPPKGQKTVAQHQETAFSWRSSGLQGDGVSEPDHLCLAVICKMSLCWKCHRNKYTGVTLTGPLSVFGGFFCLLMSSHLILTELCCVSVTFLINKTLIMQMIVIISLWQKWSFNVFALLSVFFYLYHQTDFNKNFRKKVIDAHRQLMNFWT